MMRHFNNQKKATVEGKGVLNIRISEHILGDLNQLDKKSFGKRIRYEGTINKTG